MLTPADARLDALGRALADGTRRRIVLHLRSQDGVTTADLAALAPTLTRFAVMKHIEVLRLVGIVRTMSEGRRRRHYLERTAFDPLREWLADV
jgi:DNA-binding transcriptional ArsR family regulator